MADLATQRAVAIEEYPKKWDLLVRDWASDQGDKLWLTYAANYLLNTDGVKWAIDPYSLFTRIGGGAQPDFAKDLQYLQLIILTHVHADHLDLNLISALSQLPVQWVIPEFMVEKIMHAANLSAEKIIIPRAHLPLRIANLTITPFDGLHMHGESGVPAMGYLAEFSQKRWLFPGDTRRYDFSLLPDFGELDGVIAHLWLGKAAAREEQPPQLIGFCSFFSQFKTKKLVVTHLRELGREFNDFWDFHHFQLVRTRLRKLKPELQITAALTGECIDLSLVI